MAAEDPRPAAPQAAPRPAGAGYSRAVRWLKIGLPLLALGLLSTIFLVPREVDFEGGLVYTSADLLALGEGLAVTRPRIAGATEKGEPFVVEAESASPDGPDPTRIDMAAVRAEFEQLDGRRIQLQAETGTLRPKEESLTLEGDVTLTTSDGYEVRTRTVLADLRAGTVEAPEAVSAQGPDGTIESASFRALRVRDGEAKDDARDVGAPDLAAGLSPGDYLWFEGGVRVTWTPPPENASPRGAEPGGGTAPNDGAD